MKKKLLPLLVSCSLTSCAILPTLSATSCSVSYSQIKCGIFDMNGQPIQGVSATWGRDSKNNIVGTIHNLPGNKIFNSLKTIYKKDGDVQQIHDCYVIDDQIIIPPSIDLNYKNELHLSLKYDDRIDVDIDKFVVSYATTDHLYAITGFTGTIGNANTVHIPSKLNGYDIKSFDTNYFSQKPGIKYVVIDEGIEKMYNNLFLGTKLEGNIILPSTLKSIGECCFLPLAEDESTLTHTLFMRESKTNNFLSIGRCIFQRCNFCCPLKLPKRTTTIMHEAFHDCKHLYGDLILPDSIESIWPQAFQNCVGFNGSLSLPKNDKYTNILYATFWGCSNLTGELLIPSNITYISAAAFAGCSKIKKLNFKALKLATVQGIDKETLMPGSFESMSSLREIDLTTYGTVIPAWIRDAILIQGLPIFDTVIPSGEQGIIKISKDNNATDVAKWIDYLQKIGLNNTSTDPRTATWWLQRI